VVVTHYVVIWKLNSPDHPPIRNSPHPRYGVPSVHSATAWYKPGGTLLHADPEQSLGSQANVLVYIFPSALTGLGTSVVELTEPRTAPVVTFSIRNDAGMATEQSVARYVWTKKVPLTVSPTRKAGFEGTTSIWRASAAQAGREDGAEAAAAVVGAALAGVAEAICAVPPVDWFVGTTGVPIVCGGGTVVVE